MSSSHHVSTYVSTRWILTGITVDPFSDEFSSTEPGTGAFTYLGPIVLSELCPPRSEPHLLRRCHDSWLLRLLSHKKTQVNHSSDSSTLSCQSNIPPLITDVVDEVSGARRRFSICLPATPPKTITSEFEIRHIFLNLK